MRNLFTVLFVFLSTWAMGQTLRGTVTDGETGKPLAAVSVVNMLTQQSAYTDEGGNYTITAKKGDPIAFTYVGYKTAQRATPAALSSGTLLDMGLYRLSYTLDEFVLRPRFTPYQIDSMQRASTYSRAMARQHSSAMSPVSFVAERFSKRSKRIFKFQKNFYIWEDQKFIDTRYSAELVEQLTGLTGDTLAHFMNENPMPYDYARTASELEVKMWIREKYKLWKKE